MNEGGMLVAPIGSEIAADGVNYRNTEFACQSEFRIIFGNFPRSWMAFLGKCSVLRRDATLGCATVRCEPQSRIAQPTIASDMDVTVCHTVKKHSTGS